MDIDLADLRLFVAIADAGSITRGAERVNITLASASERVRGMEATTRLTLLSRGRRGVSLTPAGETLLDHARTVLDQMQRLAGDLGEHGQGLRGSVRMLVNSAAWMEHVPKPLAAFLQTHPGVDVDIDERPSSVIVDAVAGGRADIGIVAATVNMAGLERRHFADDRLVVVASETGDWPNIQEGCTFASLLEYPFVELPQGDALQLHIAQHAARSGKRILRRANAPTFDAMAEIAAVGAGICLIPESAACRVLERLPLRYVRLSDDWTIRPLFVCCRSFKELASHAKALADHLAPEPAPQVL